MLAASFTLPATTEQSLEQQLATLAMSEGCGKDEAKTLVRHIMNIREAVDLVIEKACAQEYDIWSLAPVPLQKGGRRA